MKILRQKEFISKKLSRKAGLERTKRNTRFVGGAILGGFGRLGRQTFDFIRRPGTTIKDVGKGIKDDNVEGLKGFAKNVKGMFNPGENTYEKLKFAGKHAALMSNPIAYGAINIGENVVDFSRKKGEDVVNSLGLWRYNPVYEGAKQIGKLRRSKALGMAGQSLQGIKGMANVADNLNKAQKSIGGVWYGRGGHETAAEKNVLGANVGITADMIGNHLGKSWQKHSGVNVNKELENFRKKKDAQGFAWWYNQKIAPKLNKVAEKHDVAKEKVDTLGKKSSKKVGNIFKKIKEEFKKVREVKMPQPEMNYSY